MQTRKELLRMHTESTSQKSPSYPLGEEIANAITHGIGALLAIAALVVLIVSAATRSDAWAVVSFAIFGSSAVLLYTMSTVYHSVAAPRAKHVLEILDHSFIYLLIAGTYTPFALTVLRPSVGWWIFGVVWGSAVLGIAIKPFLVKKARFLSTLAYVLMGWIVVFAWKPLNAAVDSTTIMFLAVGGLAYTVGAVFYLMKGRRWMHAIWHLFVLAGTTMHFFSVMSLLP
ncbi:MAG: hemolysin III family protein [Clostridia bacterium]|jgi:hemolysin III